MLFLAMLLLMNAVDSLSWADGQSNQPRYVPCPAGQVPSEKGCFDKPKLLSGHSPQYPPAARRNKVTGFVELKVVLDKNGKVKSATPEYCSEPGMGFEAAAIYAVKKWKYALVIVNGEPVSVYFRVVIDFRQD